MSLYLIGKSTDGAIHIATDGQGVFHDPQPKIASDTIPKYAKIADNLIVCYSGSADAGLNLTTILQQAYRLNLSSNQATAASNTVIIGNSDLRHLDSIVRTFGAAAAQQGVDITKEAVKAHLVAHENNAPAVALLHIDFARGVTKYTSQDRDMGFPVRTGGIQYIADDIIMENVARGKMQTHDSGYTTGFLGYILQQSTAGEKGIGGSFFFASMGREGFIELSESARMDIDLAAEQVRAELEGKEYATWNQIERNLDTLSLCAAVNGDPYSFKRMAMNRMDLFMSTGKPQLIRDAIQIINAGCEHGYLEPVVAYAALGRAHGLLGEEMAAKKYFLDALANSTGILNNEMIEATLRALKGMIKYGEDKYRQDFMRVAVQAMEGWKFTKEQIKAIR